MSDMKVDFVALDVETANADITSICQIGIASFRNGNLVDVWGSLINPEVDFDAINVFIHGIDSQTVEGAPTWRQVFPRVTALLQNSIVVSHTPFDRAAVLRACDRSKLTLSECRWLDTARVIRRTWPRFSKCGYGLSNVARHFGITYQGHDALEDARCAGLLLLKAVDESGLNPEQWLMRSVQPIGGVGCLSLSQDGNPGGMFYGEVLVFTGALSISRREAAIVAAEIGCRIEDGVTKHTTMLVVGEQDPRKLGAREKSAKHRKAEQLASKGQYIRVLNESDFLQVVSESSK